jgi:endonuclease/exonuclease/phosphatase family metal-dependent hydrolase
MPLNPEVTDPAPGMTMKRILLIAIPLLSLAHGCGKKVDFSPTDAHFHYGLYAPEAAASRDSLLVVSYNIQYGEDLDLAVADLKAAAHLHPVDILLLQEMSTISADSIARALAFNYVYYPAYVHPSTGRLFGNAVLTPWPITWQRVLILPHGNPLSKDQRIAVATEIEVGGQPIRAISVHTATVVLAQEKRMEQAQTVVDSLSSVTTPIIIGGDFNTVIEYEVTLLQRLFRRAGFQRARPPGGATVDRTLLKLTRQQPVLDHIFYRGLDLRHSGIVAQADASDHLPIWATFDLSASDESAREVEPDTVGAPDSD